MGLRLWGAWVEGRLAGYLVTVQMEDCICIIDQQSHRDFLELNVNNAITFVVSQRAAAQAGVRQVFYGLESLDAPVRVSEFKFHMGYEAKALRQRILFHPCLAPLVHTYTHRIAKYLCARNPSNRLLAKAEGMLRFCLSAGCASSPAPKRGAIPEGKA